jgi:hypothetical protein
MQRMFRGFAEATKSDLKALAACARGANQPMSAPEAGQRSERRTMSRVIRIGLLPYSRRRARWIFPAAITIAR